MLKNIEVIDVRIDPFRLVLGRRQIKSGRLLPDTPEHVVCNLSGGNGVDGILIEMPIIEAFTLTARWAIDTRGLAEHRVDYRIVDQDFDAASDDTSLWKSTPEVLSWPCLEGVELPEWQSRESEKTSFYEPYMQLVEAGSRTASPLPEPLRMKHWIERMDDPAKVVKHCTETFLMPTIERERLIANPVNPRLPKMRWVFRV